MLNFGRPIVKCTPESASNADGRRLLSETATLFFQRNGCGATDTSLKQSAWRRTVHCPAGVVSVVVDHLDIFVSGLPSSSSTFPVSAGSVTLRYPAVRAVHPDASPDQLVAVAGASVGPGWLQLHAFLHAFLQLLQTFRTRFRARFLRLIRFAEPNDAMIIA